MSSSANPSLKVIDAGIALHVVLPVLSTDERELQVFTDWHSEMVRIITPEIWLPEVTSMILQGIYRNLITEEEANTAVEDVFRLHVEIIPSDEAICQAALEWASRLGQSKAYDGFYLALAERMGADFWTTDKHLANGVRQGGVEWVYRL